VRRAVLTTILVACAVAAVAYANGTTEFTVTNVGLSAYNISGNNNPTLTLTRGKTYVFHVSALGHPFDIKTVSSTGTANRFNTGVTGQGVQNGDLTFVVPPSAPNTLFYNCEVHIAMSGTINIVDRGAPGLMPFGIVALLLAVAGLGVVAVRRRRLA
jgi:hypothetical protein